MVSIKVYFRASRSTHWNLCMLADICERFGHRGNVNGASAIPVGNSILEGNSAQKLGLIVALTAERE